MVSSDDAIPEPALNVVDAFGSKNEASRRLLPVITRICGETPPGSKKPESRPEHGCVGTQRGGEALLARRDGIFVHPTLASRRRRDYLWATASKKFLPLETSAPILQTGAC